VNSPYRFHTVSTSDHIEGSGLADSHLTSPIAIQSWTTSFPVYRRIYTRDLRVRNGLLPTASAGHDWIMIEPVSPADFTAAIGELSEAYRDTFTGPPWDESGPQAAAFAEGVPRWAAREGFQAFWVRENGELIGFAFRVRTPRPVPDDGFYSLLRERFGDHVEPLAGAVEVVELAVRPRARGRGLGRDLLNAVAGAGPAWLVTRADATATREFYRRQGWRETAESDRLILLQY
jgi:ribosomal protein S18 acetylase RimI-like enzyme